MTITNNMKKAKIQFLATFAILSITQLGCIDKNEKFTGLIVAKEYIHEHMSDENPKVVEYSTAFVVRSVPVVPHVHKSTPSKVEAKWIWYVANKCSILKKEVSETVFHSQKIGDKVTVNRY